MPRCPVCHKLLTKEEYAAAIGQLTKKLTAKDAHTQHQIANLTKRLRESQGSARKAKKAGIEIERSRTQRLIKGQATKILRLNERLKNIEQGTTPQTEGLEFEDKLAARLKKEFGDQDKIEQRASRGGDVFQLVMFEGKQIGLILYECKRVPRILTSHIDQVTRDKQAQKADFAIMVSTGKRRGFDGLTQVGTILIVSPLGVIPLVKLLRAYLIDMLRAKISVKQRVQIANSLLKYITSPEFKNPIDENIQMASELQDMIKQEFKDHWRTWQKRWEHYQKITWNDKEIQKSIQLVLHNKPILPTGKRNISPLALPAPEK
jgi:hypothetical protein